MRRQFIDGVSSWSINRNSQHFNSYPKVPKTAAFRVGLVIIILGDGTGDDPFPDLGISDATADEY